MNKVIPDVANMLIIYLIDFRRLLVSFRAFHMDAELLKFAVRFHTLTYLLLEVYMRTLATGVGASTATGNAATATATGNAATAIATGNAATAIATGNAATAAAAAVAAASAATITATAAANDEAANTTAATTNTAAADDEAATTTATTASTPHDADDKLIQKTAVSVEQTLRHERASVPAYHMQPTKRKVPLGTQVYSQSRRGDCEQNIVYGFAEITGTRVLYRPACHPPRKAARRSSKTYQYVFLRVLVAHPRTRAPSCSCTFVQVHPRASAPSWQLCWGHLASASLQQRVQQLRCRASHERTSAHHRHRLDLKLGIADILRRPQPVNEGRLHSGVKVGRKGGVHGAANGERDVAGWRDGGIVECAARHMLEKRLQCTAQHTAIAQCALHRERDPTPILVDDNLVTLW